MKTAQVLPTSKHRQWFPLLPTRQTHLNNTLIADGKPTSGIFSDPVTNFRSCAALTEQVTTTKMWNILKAQL